MVRADSQSVGQWKHAMPCKCCCFWKRNSAWHSTYVNMLACASHATLVAFQRVTANKIAHTLTLFTSTVMAIESVEGDFVSCCNCCASLETVWPRPSDTPHSFHLLALHVMYTPFHIALSMCIRRLLPHTFGFQKQNSCIHTLSICQPQA